MYVHSFFFDDLSLMHFNVDVLIILLCCVFEINVFTVHMYCSCHSDGRLLNFNFAKNFTSNVGLTTLEMSYSISI